MWPTNCLANEVLLNVFLYRRLSLIVQYSTYHVTRPAQSLQQLIVSASTSTLLTEKFVPNTSARNTKFQVLIFSCVRVYIWPSRRTLLLFESVTIFNETQSTESHKLWCLCWTSYPVCNPWCKKYYSTFTNHGNWSRRMTFQSRLPR